jgi:hypothetical protein
MFFLSPKRQKEAPARRDEREVLTTNWQKTRSPMEIPKANLVSLPRQLKKHGNAKKT